MLLLCGTTSFTTDAYIGIRTARRLAGLDADPYPTDRGLESWLTFEEMKDDAFLKLRRKHPPRNRRPTAASAPAA